MLKNVVIGNRECPVIIITLDDSDNPLNYLILW